MSSPSSQGQSRTPTPDPSSESLSKSGTKANSSCGKNWSEGDCLKLIDAYKAVLLEKEGILLIDITDF